MKVRWLPDPANEDTDFMFVVPDDLSSAQAQFPSGAVTQARKQDADTLKLQEGKFYGRSVFGFGKPLLGPFATREEAEGAVLEQYSSVLAKVGHGCGLAFRREDSLQD